MKERLKSILMEAFQIWKVIMGFALILASMFAIVVIIAFLIQFIVIHIPGPFNIIFGTIVGLLSSTFSIALLIAILDNIT